MMVNVDNLLWEKYTNLLSGDFSKKTDLEKQFVQYSVLIHETTKFYSSLEKKLQGIPIGVALRYWLSTITNKVKQKGYLQNIVLLIEKEIIPVKNLQGELWTLNQLREHGEEEHKRIIEEIKCIVELSTSVKEELVKCYIEFSQHLYQNTLGIIPIAQDSDQFYASHKVVSYENFLRFVQLLSERDAFIAKLLYFGGPTVEEVLFLKYSQLDFNNCRIIFSKISVNYPKHLMLGLLNFAGKKKKNDLIFLNYKGNQVVRTHLNQSFGRASKEIHPKITPRDLLKLKL